MRAPRPGPREDGTAGACGIEELGGRRQPRTDLALVVAAMTLLQSRARQFADYLRRYAEAYRAEWSRFTAAPPGGGGYPALHVSPYLDSGEIVCYIGTDGVAVCSFAWEPPSWFIAGGPALMVAPPGSSVPRDVEQPLKVARGQARTASVAEGGPPAENIGIYRIGGDASIGCSDAQRDSPRADHRRRRNGRRPQAAHGGACH